MTAFGDALRAVREVLLLQSQVERLDKAVVKLGDDLESVTKTTIELNGRVSQIEGFLRGAAAAGGFTPRQLPPG